VNAIKTVYGQVCGQSCGGYRFMPCDDNVFIDSRTLDVRSISIFRSMSSCPLPPRPDAIILGVPRRQRFWQTEPQTRSRSSQW